MSSTHHRSSKYPIRISALLFFVSCIFLSHCGGTPLAPEEPVAPVPGELTLSSRPNPVRAVASTDSAFTWMVTFTLTARELGGVAGEITNIQADLEESTGSITVATGNTDYTFRVSAPEGSRVPAFGSQRVDFEFFYTIERGSPESIISIEALYIDDNEFETKAAIRIPVVG